jgi:hypothetical protein
LTERLIQENADEPEEAEKAEQGDRAREVPA